MEMETEETLTIPPSTTSDKSLSPVFLWCSVGNSGLKKQKLEIDLNSLTLTELKNAATKELGLKSPEEIGIFTCNLTNLDGTCLLLKCSL